MIVGPNVINKHCTEKLDCKGREFILSERGDNRAPSSGAFMWSFEEDLTGEERELGFGIEVDEVMRYERDGLNA